MADWVSIKVLNFETVGTVPPTGNGLGHTLVWDAQRNRLVLFGGQARGFRGHRRKHGCATSPPSRPTVRPLSFSVAVPSQAGSATNCGPWVRRWLAARKSAEGIGSVYSGAPAPVAPRQLVSLFGSGLGLADGVAVGLEGGRLPVSGAGVNVTVNGVPAPLTYLRADQLALRSGGRHRSPAGGDSEWPGEPHRHRARPLMLKIGEGQSQGGIVVYVLGL